jgi:hypothetical protein
VYSASVDLLIVGSRGYGPIGRLCTGAPRGAWRARRAARCSCSHAVRRARSPTTRIAKVSGRLRGDLARKATANRRRVASGWVLSAAIAGALLATAGCGSSKSARSAPGRVATRLRREAAVVVSDLSYRSVSGETLGITLRQPGRPRALIVLVHGGGFRGGARSDMTVWALMLTADGYATRDDRLPALRPGVPPRDSAEAGSAGCLRRPGQSAIPRSAARASRGPLGVLGWGPDGAAGGRGASGPRARRGQSGWVR